MRLLPLALLALAVAAPTAAAAPVLGPQSYLGTRVSGELDPKEEPTNRPADVGGAPLQLKSTYIGRKAIEPTIALDKQGNAFYPASTFENPVNGVGGHSYLMRSSDQNATWQDIEPATSINQDPPRDLDPWVYADPDTGRVFDIGLLLAGSYLSFSDDAGETWTSTFLSDPGVNDHQSIVTAVPPAGNPTMVPRDPAFPKIVYYCVNGVARHGCSASRDGGVTFISTGGNAYHGVEVDGGLCSALTGHVQADAEGRLFIPAGHCGRPEISVSEDGGITWDQVRVSQKIDAADTHTEVAVDKAGNLYYLWHDSVHFLPWMATSTDHGKTWSDPVMVAPPGVFSANLPTIVAGEPGRVALTFAGSTTADETDRARPWNAYVAVSTNALSPEPLFRSTIANAAGDPIHRGVCNGRCGGMFDFIDIQISPADGSIWATSSDSCTAEQDCNIVYEGDAAGGAVDAAGVAIRQTGGPRLVGDTPADGPVTALPAKPSPFGGRRDTKRPVVRSFSASRRSFRAVRGKRRGRVSKAVTRFRFKLSEAGTVALEFRRGRKRVGVIRSSAAKGVNGLPFTGRFGSRALRRGVYRVSIVAVDSSRNRSRARTLKLRVR